MFLKHGICPCTFQLPVRLQARFYSFSDAQTQPESTHKNPGTPNFKFLNIENQLVMFFEISNLKKRGKQEKD